MRIVELVIDDNDDNSPIEAISLVENPAIEENFLALSKNKEYKFAEINAEKRLLMGAVLVPNKPIYRKDGDEEYYIYFTKDTVRKAAELYLTKGNQNNSTYEHIEKIDGVSLVESWILESKSKDKSVLYGMDLPLGAWVGTVKVYNDEIWDSFVRTGLVKGFSIEGYFADRAERPKEKFKDNLVPRPKTLDNGKWDTPLNKEIQAGKKLLKIKENLVRYTFETYNDYPTSASNNAKRAIKYKEENDSKCGTRVGWTRARQLADRKNISRDTIARMASFKRHQQNKDVPYEEGCGGLMWDAWGGASGINWAINKLKSLK